MLIFSIVQTKKIFFPFCLASCKNNELVVIREFLFWSKVFVLSVVFILNGYLLLIKNIKFIGSEKKSIFFIYQKNSKTYFFRKKTS